MERPLRRAKDFFSSSNSFMTRARRRSVGYARIGIDEAGIMLQVAELKVAGCQYVFEELKNRVEGLRGIRLGEAGSSLH